jgi:hypothetical protein
MGAQVISDDIVYFKTTYFTSVYCVLLIFMADYQHISRTYR